MPVSASSTAAPRSIAVVAFASFIGTAIEFYDFYIYGTAAALVLGPVYFPKGDPARQTLNVFLIFGIGFLARPVGAVLFGHFGDRIGRKRALVVSLMMMGVSTVSIGLLPGHDRLGWLAPALLCVLRFGQGIGLGGEWGGAALLATENAPEGRRAWYGMFPQLGPPVGFLCANGSFLVLSVCLSDAQFREWGWRVPFVLSSALVVLGLYLRMKLVETPVFARALERRQPLTVPLAKMLKHHARAMALGALAIVVCYALFYISTVFALSYGIEVLQIPRARFLTMLCVAIVFMAAAIPLSAWASDRIGRRPVLLIGAAAALLSGFAIKPLLGGNETASITAYLALELFLMGVTFAPMGAMLPEMFPTEVRYTGSAVAYNLGGVLGASFAPYFANVLVTRGGLSWVGGYISVAAAVSMIAVLMIRETRGRELE
jgi:metabolite-proton symporter